MYSYDYWQEEFHKELTLIKVISLINPWLVKLINDSLT